QAASYRNHKQIVQQQLDNEADVNAQDGYYCNAYQVTSTEGHEQAMKVLLQKGAYWLVKGITTKTH
ncbi:uncharacterized protein BDR25DRAFT_214185, partial [Lindgomyces ingoldianus]